MLQNVPDKLRAHTLGVVDRYRTRQRRQVADEIEAIRAVVAGVRDELSALRGELSDDVLAQSMSAVTHQAELASEHAAERAIGAARDHTDVVVSDARDSAIAVARQHTEAATANAIERSVSVAREHTEAAAADALERSIAVSHEHADAAVAVAIETLRGEIASVRKELARIDDARSGAAPSGHGSPPVTRAEHTVSEVMYAGLEDRFRGRFELIRDRQRQYLPLVIDVVNDDYPAIDLGSGRGEWLSVLTEQGLRVRGIDANAVAVTEAVAAGLPAEHGDLVEVLASTASGSVGAVTLFQVVEHLPFGLLVEVFAECARVLRPGGVLIAETPNALNVQVASANFWLDPTHQRPLHPELLRFLAIRAGFATIDDVFTNDLAPPPDLVGLSESAQAIVTDLERRFNGPGDYALIARTPVGLGAG